MVYRQRAVPMAAMPMAPLLSVSNKYLEFASSISLDVPWVAAIELLHKVCYENPESPQY